MVTSGLVIRWLRILREACAQNRDHLTRLDADIGDADHGINLDRGFAAVVAGLDREEAGAAGGAEDGAAPDGGGPISRILKSAALALMSTVGGASGPLYGTFFLRAAAAAEGKEALGPQELCALFRAGLEGVVQRGKAGPGDKTMVDALLPAVQAMERAAAEGRPAAEALAAAERAAGEGMRATAPMLAKKGRASYLGERSIGHQDPGATSAWLLVKAAAEAWSGEAHRGGRIRRSRPPRQAPSSTPEGRGGPGPTPAAGR